MDRDASGLGIARPDLRGFPWRDRGTRPGRRPKPRQEGQRTSGAKSSRRALGRRPIFRGANRTAFAGSPPFPPCPLDASLRAMKASQAETLEKPRAPDPAALKRRLVADARAEGFELVGVTRPDAIPEAAPRLRQFLAEGQHGTMDWLEAKATAAPAPRALWPEVGAVVMLGLNYGPDADPLATLAATRPRHHLGLCPPPRLSRSHQGQAQAHRRPLRRSRAVRRQGLRRYRAADGKAAGRRRRPRLAGQAHQSRQPRLRLVALPRRHPHRDRRCRPTKPRPTVAAPAAPASTSARPTPSRRPTGSMPAAASPISPSSMPGRSRANSVPPWATASMAATIASPSARGTSSRERPTRRS